MFDVRRLLNGLPERVTITFFAAFARFEYALMQGGFLIPCRNGQQARADWTQLSKALGDEFFAEVAPKLPTLVSDPPKKLIIWNHTATFGESPIGPDSTRQLLTYACQVRHNLFHGNKMYAADRKRDEQLMREVLWLLEFVMEKRPEIRFAFEEPRYL